MSLDGGCQVQDEYGGESGSFSRKWGLEAVLHKTLAVYFQQLRIMTTSLENSSDQGKTRFQVSTQKNGVVGTIQSYDL